MAFFVGEAKSFMDAKATVWRNGVKCGLQHQTGEQTRPGSWMSSREPTGWSYYLAACLLADSTKTGALSRRMVEKFHREVVSLLGLKWCLTTLEILEWVAAYKDASKKDKEGW